MEGSQRFFRRLVLAGFCLLGLSAGVTAQPDHSPWGVLLGEHVRVLEGGVATEVDYRGFARQRPQLQAYLTSLSKITPADYDAWSPDIRLAFLINAYNAWTVDLILQRYPDLDSIRDLGTLFRSPWKRAFIPLLGQTVSLDDIEHGMIRAPGVFDEPRIHFAVNCASIGCPALRPEPFLAATLDAQLEQATRLFLSDRSRNRHENDRLYVSEVFRWYREDFEKGWRGTDSLGQFLARYREALGLDAESARRLASGAIPIRYLDYDWRLNDVTNP